MKRLSHLSSTRCPSVGTISICARCYGDSMRKLGLAMKEIPRARMSSLPLDSAATPPQIGAATGKADPTIPPNAPSLTSKDQLQLLNVDYLDGMLIHDPIEIDPTLEKGGTLEGLLQCKARGLVNYVGYGMRQHDFHLKARATGDVDLILCFKRLQPHPPDRC